MPVYNAAAYLAEAVESVLGQTLEDVELVAVDDGSEDDTHAILEQFARADRRVRIIANEQNLGIARSRNLGWRAARSPYIATQDADDVSLPDRLRRQAEFLDSHPSIAAVGTMSITIGPDGQRLSTRRYPLTPRAIESTLLRRNCMEATSVTMRRTALEAVGGYRVVRSEDYDLWLRLSERFQLANLPDTLVMYRVHPAQASVVTVEAQARWARAIAAAARARRSSGVDPLANVDDVTPEVLRRLAIDESEVSAAVETELITRASMMADLGRAEDANELLEHASRTVGPSSAKAFAAHNALRQADALMRARRPVAAARNVLRAYQHHPRRAHALVTEWLTPRLPGGRLNKWR